MGNRAVVKFVDEDSKHGVYLHWNGGPESILAFLQVMEARGWTRMDYASARFVQVVGEFFDAEGTDQGLSLAIVDDPDTWKDGCDNGLYTVTGDGQGFRVTRRGKVLSFSKLPDDDKAKCLGIIEDLARCRAKRQEKQAVTA